MNDENVIIGSFMRFMFKNMLYLYRILLRMSCFLILFHFMSEK